MKLLTNQASLQKEFRRLIKQYNKFYWATAWAGINSNPFNDLCSHQNKINKIIVGIHFYQTHPDFIETFIFNKKVRFILQPDGTFHPKLYLFVNSEDEWELLIGSGNFTNAAFIKNKEATILISQDDDNSIEVLEETKNLINDVWKEAKYLTAPQLEKYRTTWKNHRQKIKSLSGLYGSLSDLYGSKKRKPKPIHEVPVISMSWNEFTSKVQNEPKYGPFERLKVLTKSRELFNKVDQFNELTEDERKFIAGVPNNLDNTINWGLFGSMKGAGIFRKKIIENDENISTALGQVPLSGQITRIHYDNFIKYFKNIYTGNYIAPATRLLCMKRPDTFICLDSKNKSALSKDFGLSQSKKMNYDRYWDDVIVRIFDSDWWLNPDPINEEEEKISKARAAFLDSLYYEEKK